MTRLRYGCEARQVSDQMRCERCDLLWDINDDDAPPCRPEKVIVVGNPSAGNWALKKMRKILK